MRETERPIITGFDFSPFYRGVSNFAGDSDDEKGDKEFLFSICVLLLAISTQSLFSPSSDLTSPRLLLILSTPPRLPQLAFILPRVPLPNLRDNISLYGTIAGT